MDKQINHASEMDATELTFGKLRKMYGTGRSLIISGSGRDRKTAYRTGVMTELGDIEILLWEKLVRDLIIRSGEQALYENLMSFYKETLPFLYSESEREHYMLELHAARIFDNEQWVDYAAFNKRYRPDRL